MKKENQNEAKCANTYYWSQEYRDGLLDNSETEEDHPKYYDEPEEMTWYEAMKKYKNHPVYRLMTSEELKKHYEDETLEDLSDYYWSSSENDNNFAWFVNFSDGYAVYLNKGSSLRVRVVSKEMVETTITPRDLIELGFEEVYQDVDYGEPGYIFYSHEIKGVGFYSVDTDDKDFHVRMDNGDYEIRNLRKLRNLILNLNEIS